SSLGGIAALSEVLSALPANFPAPIIIVQHLQPFYKSQLDEILNRRTALTVKWAEQGERLCAGNVYLAPPDYHVMILPPGIIALSHSEKVQFVRPSANTLFDSVAAYYGERAIAVVLTGAGSDGASGVQAIKHCGGKVLVQNMRTSQAFGMPGAALKTGCVDFTLSLRIIARALVSLVMVNGASQFFCPTQEKPAS
ncbi:MAG TPA: chemotaxis protein CheB, partial [Ktedonobacter sp.]|nr:chemotaxis protein CheB [Ktedonobacter sp.]